MNNKGYYVRLGTEVSGPFTMNELKVLKEQGRLQAFHCISLDCRTWMPASCLAQLFPPSSMVANPVQTSQQSTVGPPAQDEWYYIDSSGNQVGPISLAQLRELVLTGWITDKTLIWRQDLPNWVLYSQVFTPTLHQAQVAQPAILADTSFSQPTDSTARNTFQTSDSSSSLTGTSNTPYIGAILVLTIVVAGILGACLLSSVLQVR